MKLRHVTTVVVIVISLLGLTGCSKEMTKDDFVYRLVTEKDTYNVGESVALYAELEYVGRGKNVTIYHEASPFYFLLVESTRNYGVPFAMDQPGLRTVLRKGEPLSEEYRPAGFYLDENDKDYVEFIEAVNRGELPEGHYILDGNAKFSIMSGEDEKEFNIKAHVQFDVIE